jgi:hypothetical protein
VSLALRRAQLLQQREVVLPAAIAGAAAAAHCASPSLNGRTRGEEEEFFATEKKRCLMVLLDTLGVLLLGGGGKSVSSPLSGGSNGGASNARSTDMDLSVSSSLSSSVPSPSSESLSVTRERVLSQVLASPDSEVHAAVYNWFIEKGLLRELYSVQNEQVVQFLSADDDRLLLLDEYYVTNQRWWEAARLLNFLALSKSERYTLAQRHDFLARSLQYARLYQQQLPKSTPPSSAVRGGGGKHATPRGLSSALALASSSSSEVADFIQQLQDRFDIAEIQLDIFQQLHTSKEDVYSTSAFRRPDNESDALALQNKRAELSAALARLDFELLDLQSLYALASALGLWESCLRIFAFSGERARSDVIQALWKNILRAPMAQCKRQRIDWGEQVAQKIIQLASSPLTNYRETDFLFPLTFLLRELETYNVLHRSEPDAHYVVATMLAAGIPPARLLHAYETLLDSAERSIAEQPDATTEDARGSGWNVHRQNARGQSVHTFLFYSIHHLLTHISDSDVRRTQTQARNAPACLSVCIRLMGCVAFVLFACVCVVVVRLCSVLPFVVLAFRLLPSLALPRLRI